MATDFSQLHLLERAIAAASNGIVIADAADPQNPIIYCNRAFEKVTGYTSQEIIGRNCRFLHGPDTDPQTLEQIRNALRQEQEIKVILKNYRKDKTTFWNELTISPVRDPNGKLTHFIGVQNDISDTYRELHLRKQAEKELLESRQMYEQILDAIPDMVMCKGPHSRLIYGNKAFRDLYGMTNDQLRGIIDSPFNNPDYTQQYVIDDAYVFNSGKSLNISEEPITKYDGEVRIFQTVKTPIKDSEGKVIQIVVVSHDITERKLAEAVLRKSEAHNCALLNAIPDAMFRFSPEGVYLDCIAPLDWPLFLPREELIGKSVLEVMPPELAFCLQNAITEALANCEPQIREYSIVNKEKLQYFEARIVAIEDTECLAIIREITDRKQAENQLKIVNEQLENRVQERTAALQDSQQMLRLVIDNIPQAVFWKDRNLVYLGCNQKLARIAGLSDPAKIVGKTDWDLPWKPEESEFCCSR